MGGVAISDSGGGRGKKPVDAYIQLVPFIDLLCTLISFLLMTAVWNQISRLELKQGNAAPDQAIPEQTPDPNKVELRIEVHETGFTIVENNKVETKVDCTAMPCTKVVKQPDGKDGKVRDVLESTYDYKILEERLKEKKAAHPDNKNIIVVIADGVPYYEMIKTMDACLGVGLDGISVSGTPL